MPFISELRTDNNPFTLTPPASPGKPQLTPSATRHRDRAQRRRR